MNARHALFIFCVLDGFSFPAPISRSNPTEEVASDSRSHLPLLFEPNWGQAKGDAQFLLRNRNYTALLKPEALIFTLYYPSSPEALPNNLNEQFVVVEFEGARKEVRMRGRDVLPVRSNYFIGNDPRRWKTNIPQHAHVWAENIYPGVSIDYYSFWDALSTILCSRLARIPLAFISGSVAFNT